MQKSQLVSLLAVAFCVLTLWSPAEGHDPRFIPRLLRFRAHLDAGQVVRPPKFQPPGHGSGSEANGEATLEIDSVEGHYTFELTVRGINPEALDDAHGPNRTSIQLSRGNSRGGDEILLDVQHFARELRPETNGVTPTDDGFTLLAQGTFSSAQGAATLPIRLIDILEALRGGNAFVTVFTSTEELFLFGEIRGKLERVPEFLRFAATIDRAHPRGLATFRVNTITGYFSFDVEVDGIGPRALDSSYGSNATAIHIRRGASGREGAIILDVHQFARSGKPNALSATDTGFRLSTTGELARQQGSLDTELEFEALIDVLRREETSVVVSTTKAEAFMDGSVSGRLESLPNRIHATALLDEKQVIRPPGLQPPKSGTGSTSKGSASLEVDADSGLFHFELDIDGISPSDLDNSHGANGTAVHLNWGSESTRGPLLIDVHSYANSKSPSSGVVATETGFRLEVDGQLRKVQGLHDTLLTLEKVLTSIRENQVYVSVHTAKNDLFRSGEIRGNFRVEEPIDGPFRLRAMLDGDQVVRPLEFQPPKYGSGSTSTGTAELAISPDGKDFLLELSVTGIEIPHLHEAVGPNATAVHIYRGDPLDRGSILLDAHLFALLARSVEETDDGFFLVAHGPVNQVQGTLDTGWARQEALDLLLSGNTYVQVHTNKKPLFEFGEIRGQLLPVEPDEPGAFVFLRGDCDGDGKSGGSVTDSVFLLRYNFLGGAHPPCLAACDADGDGRVKGRVGDAVYLLTYGFLSGNEPPPPFPACGSGTDRDAGLGCRTPPAACGE